MPVYVIQAESGGPCKIGWARDPKARLATLQIGSPLPLRLVLEVEGGIALEAKLHKEFSDQRMHGEWFNAAPHRILAAAMADCCGQVEEPEKPMALPRSHPLSVYIRDNNETLVRFGRRIGVSHAAVSRWISGKRLPSLRLMRRIEAETGGAVPLSVWSEPHAPHSHVHAVSVTDWTMPKSEDAA